MKIKVTITVDKIEARKVIEVPDDASDSDKDKAALEAVDGAINIWWEDIN